jgi:hypothetical protein
MKYCLFCFFLGTLVTGQLVRGQTANQAQNRADLLRAQANPTYSPPPGATGTYAPASPNDKDLGDQELLERQERYQPFTVSISTPIYYTSNAALVKHGAEGAALFAPAISAAYQPRLIGNLYGDIGVTQQFFVYSRFSELDFASFDAIAGVTYYIPQFHNLALRAIYDYNRLTDTDDFDEFFVDHSYILSASVPFHIRRAQQVTVGVDTQLSFESHPDGPRRNDYSVYAAYSVSLSRSFSLDATGRITVHDYDTVDRTDVTEILALSASYHMNDWFTLSLLSSFAWNQSDRSVFDYDVADVGGAMTLIIRF